MSHSRPPEFHRLLGGGKIDIEPLAMHMTATSLAKWNPIVALILRQVCMHELFQSEELYVRDSWEIPAVAKRSAVLFFELSQALIEASSHGVADLDFVLGRVFDGVEDSVGSG